MLRPLTSFALLSENVYVHWSKAISPWPNNSMPTIFS